MAFGGMDAGAKRFHEFMRGPAAHLHRVPAARRREDGGGVPRGRPRHRGHRRWQGDTVLDGASPLGAVAINTLLGGDNLHIIMIGLLLMALLLLDYRLIQERWNLFYPSVFHFIRFTDFLMLLMFIRTGLKGSETL